MRMSYPGTFPAEFLFRNATTHPFSQVQFIPEEILEFSVSPEGLRFYKVHWQDNWVLEHQLFQYQNIVDAFWRKQNDSNSQIECNSDALPKTSIIPDVQPGEEPSSSRLNTKHINDESYMTALQSTANIDLGDPTLATVSLIIEKPLNDNLDKDLNALKQSLEERSVTNPVNQSNFNESVLNLISTEAINLHLKEGENEDAPDSEMIDDDSPDTEEYDRDKSSENEFTKVACQSTRYQQDNNKLSTVRCDGFDIVNVENDSVSEEDIRIQAREVLCTFNKKRPRCPNGSSNLPHACFFCTKVLSSRKKLREHQFSIHFKNIGEFVCQICQHRFAFRRKLKAHMITHSDSRSFVCEICGLTCKRRTHLHSHMETHNKERNYRCDVCHKTFKVQAELKTHCLSEHKNQVTTCNVCKQTLQTAFSVYVHSMRHSGTRDHICEECGASFKSKHHLTAHEKIHSSAVEKIKCPACEEVFAEKKYFRKHIEVSHKELAAKYRYDYTCTICDKDFAYKGRLDEHMKTHADETDELNARLKNRQAKKVESMSENHLAELSDKVEKITSKTGEVKVKCKLCRRRVFRLISTMEKHLKEHEEAGTLDTVDDDGDGFECPVCNKLLNSEAGFLRHTHLHKQEEKLQTFQCGKQKQRVSTKKGNTSSKGKRGAALNAKLKLQIQTEEESASHNNNVAYQNNQEGAVEEDGRSFDHIISSPDVESDVGD